MLGAHRQKQRVELAEVHTVLVSVLRNPETSPNVDDRDVGEMLRDIGK